MAASYDEKNKTKTNTTEPATNVQTDPTCTHAHTRTRRHARAHGIDCTQNKNHTYVHARTLRCNLCAYEHVKMIINTEMYNKLTTSY